MSELLLEVWSWDAILKIIEIELKLVPDMYILFEKDTKGGISHISNRYSKINDKYLKSYDQGKNQNIFFT